MKNINYESKNVDIYKDDSTSEIFGSLGLLSEINFQKFRENSKHFLNLNACKIVSWKHEARNKWIKINPYKCFDMNRISSINNYETGITAR